MRTTRGLFQRLCDADDLDVAAHAAAHGKRRRPDVAWFLLFVPVLEAGMKFSLISGMFVWLSLSAAALTVEWLYRPGYSLSEQLTAIAGRMGIVLLVAIPGIYLAQKLLVRIPVAAKSFFSSSMTCSTTVPRL